MKCGSTSCRPSGTWPAIPCCYVTRCHGQSSYTANMLKRQTSVHSCWPLGIRTLPCVTVRASTDDPKTLPEKVPVTCNAVPGVLDSRNVFLTCRCRACLEHNPEGRAWEPELWPAHCGSDKHGWLTAVQVPSAQSKPVPLRRWLESQGHKVHTNKPITPGGPPPRQILPLAGVPPERFIVPPPQEAAFRAGDGNQEVDPGDVLPEEVRVECYGRTGRFFPDLWKIQCLCSACAASPSMALMTPGEWEKHTGSRAKKSSASIYILPGQVPEIPAGAAPVNIQNFLARKGLRVKPRGPRGGPRKLQPLNWAPFEDA